MGEPLKLGLDHYNNVDLKEMKTEEIEANFAARNTEAMNQLKNAIAHYNAELEIANSKVFLLQEMKKQAIQKITEDLQKDLVKGMAAILENYKQACRQGKKMLTKCLVMMAASFVAVGMFAAALAAAIQSATAISMATAKMVAETLIFTVVQHAVTGGNLKQFVTNLGKNLAFSGAAFYGTAAVNGGATIQNLPANASNARAVVITQRTLESVIRAAATGKNPLKVGLITAITADIMSSSPGLTSAHPKYDAIFFKVSVATLGSILLGEGKEQVLSAAISQLLNSSNIFKTKTGEEVEAAPVEEPAPAVHNEADTFSNVETPLDATLKRGLNKPNEYKQATLQFSGFDTKASVQQQKQNATPATTKTDTSKPAIASAKPDVVQPKNTKSAHSFSNSNEFAAWLNTHADTAKVAEYQYKNDMDTFVRQNRAHTINISYQRKSTRTLFWDAINGDNVAQYEMRSRWPNGVNFFDSFDPNLTRSMNDGIFMSESKMYGRVAKNVGNTVLYVLGNPHIVARDAFLFGADNIEGALHYYGGKSYNPASRERNLARMDAMVKLWNADGLTQREAILTMGTTTMLFGAANLGLAEAGVNSVRGIAASTRNLIGKYSSNKVSRNQKYYHSTENFNSGGDRLQSTLGPARLSHQEEYSIIMNELNTNGVKVDFRANQYAYGPAKNAPGNLVIDPEASISALRHEFGHFMDDKLLGFPGMKFYLENPKFRLASERRQYLNEIQTAKSLNDLDARRKLILDYIEEKQFLISRFYTSPYGEKLYFKLRIE